MKAKQVATSGASPSLENALNLHFLCESRLSSPEERVLTLLQRRVSVSGLGSGRRAAVPSAGDAFPIRSLTGIRARADLEHTRRRRKLKARGQHRVAPKPSHGHVHPAGLLGQRVCPWSQAELCKQGGSIHVPCQQAKPGLSRGMAGHCRNSCRFLLSTRHHPPCAGASAGADTCCTGGVVSEQRAGGGIDAV